MKITIKVSKAGLNSGTDYKELAIKLMNHNHEDWWVNCTNFVSDAYVGAVLHNAKIVYGNNHEAAIDPDKLRSAMNEEWRKVLPTLKHPVMTKADTRLDDSATVDFVKRIIAAKDFDKYENTKLASTWSFDFYTCALVTDAYDAETRSMDESHMSYILEPFFDSSSGTLKLRYKDFCQERTDAIYECFKRAEENLEDIERYRSNHSVEDHCAAVAGLVEQIVVTVADLKLVGSKADEKTKQSANNTIRQCVEKIAVHHGVSTVFKEWGRDNDDIKDIRKNFGELLINCTRLMQGDNAINDVHKYWEWYRNRVSKWTEEEMVTKLGKELTEKIKAILDAERLATITKAINE